MRFCKELLGVQKQTTNIGVLLELGRVPLILFAKKNSIKNWVRINTGKANQVLLEINMSNDVSLNWTNTITDCLNKTGGGGGGVLYTIIQFMKTSFVGCKIFFIRRVC